MGYDVTDSGFLVSAHAIHKASLRAAVLCDVSTHLPRDGDVHIWHCVVGLYEQNSHHAEECSKCIFSSVLVSLI